MKVRTSKLSRVIVGVKATGAVKGFLIPNDTKELYCWEREDPVAVLIDSNFKYFHEFVRASAPTSIKGLVAERHSRFLKSDAEAAKDSNLKDSVIARGVVMPSPGRAKI